MRWGKQSGFFLSWAGQFVFLGAPQGQVTKETALLSRNRRHQAFSQWLAFPASSALSLEMKRGRS